jgi:hypothetical protein
MDAAFSACVHGAYTACVCLANHLEAGINCTVCLHIWWCWVRIMCACESAGNMDHVHSCKLKTVLFHFQGVCHKALVSAAAYMLHY